MMAAAAIRIAGLVKTFGKHRAVDGLDLEVPQGSIFGFLGRNGAGKTTTIKILMNMLKPTAGTVEVLGHDPELLILDEPASGLDVIVRRDVLESIIQVISAEGRTVLLLQSRNQLPGYGSPHSGRSLGLSGEIRRDSGSDGGGCGDFHSAFAPLPWGLHRLEAHCHRLAGPDRFHNCDGYDL